MKEYLKALIIEQIERGKSLKKLIPHPLKFPELNSLASRCEMIIERNIDFFKYLLKILEMRQEDDLRDIFRDFRDSARQLALIEYYGISALYYQTEEIGYLNKLAFKIHQEINLPVGPPSVACISTKYYFFHPLPNVIFVPVAESDFLLHLPDLYHEIGHAALANSKSEVRLEKLYQSYQEVIKQITDHYDALIISKKRALGPEELPRLISFIHSQWKEYWVSEFFADLFGLYTLGPAYAWSHIHLTIKKSNNVYEFSKFFPRTHPSDEARMRILKHGLKQLGFDKEVEEIWALWAEVPEYKNFEPVSEYQYAYPDDLLRDIASTVYDGVAASNFSCATPDCLKDLKNDSITKILNEAWKSFWKNPEGFRGWEESKIKFLKNQFQVN
jgi:hypothetical protein